MIFFDLQKFDEILVITNAEVGTNTTDSFAEVTSSMKFPTTIPFPSSSGGDITAQSGKLVRPNFNTK